jgi:hypothetical protein
MPETITLHALDLSGETTLKLFLRKDDGTLLNTGGDDLAEIGSSGVFTATLTESRTELGDLSYRVCLATETADNLLIDGFLPETETTIGASSTAVLDPAITAQLNAIEDDSAASVGYLDTLVGRLTANAATAIQNLWHMITGTGAASKFTAGSLENAAGASGDWTNTEKAQIRYRLGLEGTATEPPQPDVDPIVITPATGILTTGYLVTRVKGVPTAGITIRYQQAQEPAADRGSSYDDNVYSAVSNSQGIAELSLVKGGLYYVWRTAQSRPMNVQAYRVLKSDGSAPDATLALPSHVGA